MNSNNSLKRTFLGSLMEILIVAIILSFSCNDIKPANNQDLDAETTNQVWLSPPSGNHVSVFQFLGKIRIASILVSALEIITTIPPNCTLTTNSLFSCLDNLYYANIRINAP
jgi:hypothetical protein